MSLDCLRGQKRVTERRFLEHFATSEYLNAENLSKIGTKMSKILMLQKSSRIRNYIKSNLNQCNN